ncbi:MAG: RelA/SpoT domain-containing protein [Armatimonadota bacterium]
MSKDTKKLIVESSEDFLRQRETYVKLARKIEDRCRTVLRGVIHANFQNRAKSKESFRAKIEMKRDVIEASGLVSTNQVVTLIGDLAGVRILTYDEHSRQRAVELILEEFGSEDGKVIDLDIKDESPEKYDPREGRFYRSTHLSVYWPENDCVDDDENLRGLPCEIQISSLLAHVWNEIEHDITYKPANGLANDAQKAFLKILGGLTVAGDDVLRELLKQDLLSDVSGNDQFSNAFDFGVRVSKLYPSLSLPDGRTGQLFEVTQALNISKPSNLKSVVDPANLTKHIEEVKEYNLILKSRFDTRLLNTTDSDVLAFALAKAKGKEIIQQFPNGRGTGVPLRICRIARNLEGRTI